MTEATSCATQGSDEVQSENAAADRRSVFVMTGSYAAPKHSVKGESRCILFALAFGTICLVLVPIAVVRLIDAE